MHLPFDQDFEVNKTSEMRKTVRKKVKKDQIDFPGRENVFWQLFS